jgi:hypothetical protein
LNRRADVREVDMNEDWRLLREIQDLKAWRKFLLEQYEEEIYNETKRKLCPVLSQGESWVGLQLPLLPHLHLHEYVADCLK